METPKLPKQLSEASVLDEFTLTLSDDSLSLKGAYDLIVPDLILTNSSATVGENELYRNVTVKSGGTLYISSGGFAEDVFVSSGGRLVILDGGIASGVTAEGSGYATVSSGGKMISAYLAGGNCEEQVIIEEGGILSSAKMVSGLNLVVRGSAYDVDFSEGSGDYTDLFLLGNGYVENASFGDNSNLSMEGGTRINGLTIYGSNILIGVPSDAKIENLRRTPFTNDEYYNSIPAGAIISYDYTDYIGVFYGSGNLISSAASMGSLTLEPGYSMFVMPGGVANDISVLSGASLEVTSGGVVTGVAVKKGGKLSLFSGGTATNVDWTPFNGAIVEVDDGASISFAEQYKGVFYGYGDTLISSALVMDGQTVEGGKQMLVVTSGRADNTVVETGGEMRVSSGGVANAATVKEDAWFHVAGGEANDTVVSGSVETIEWDDWTETRVLRANMSVTGGVANNIGLVFGNMTVGDGGVINGVIISGTRADYGDWSSCERSYLTVSSGGEVNDAVGTWGEIKVSSGGVANRTVLSGFWDNNGFGDWCYLTVYNGGVMNDTVLKEGGSAAVSRGGEANRTTLSGGYFEVGSGVANDTTLNGGHLEVGKGGVVNSALLNGGYLCVSSGAQANGLTVNDGARIFVAKGGSAAEILENGGWVEIEDGANVTFVQNTFSGLVIADGHSATVNSKLALQTTLSGGILSVRKGGIASETVIKRGELRIDGGLASETTIIGDYLNVYHGGVASKTTVKGGNLSVNEGGVALETIVTNGGGLNVNSGGLASNSLVQDNLNVWEGGKAVNTTVEGAMNLYYGGTASNTILKSGYLYVHGGCTADTVILVNGDLYVDAVGSALNILRPGNKGNVYLYSDESVATYLPETGVYYLDADGNLSSATEMSSMTIGSSCWMFVFDGGTAQDISVTEGGTLLLFSGGTATNVDWPPFNGAIVEVDDGASISFAEQYKGVFYGYGDTLISSALVMDGQTVEGGKQMLVVTSGRADNTVVETGGEMRVSSGGVANAATVKEDAWLHVTGGEANDTVVRGSAGNNWWDIRRANMTITQNGVAGGTLVEHGEMTLASGGTANNTTVNSGGNLRVSAGGTANSTTVNSGGSLLIYNGGEVNDTTVNSNGWMHASSGGTATDMALTGGILEIGRGGEANNTTVNSNGRLTVFSTGVANSTTVLFGSMTVSSGATANGIELSGFGSSGGVVSNGVLTVTPGGTADNIIMNNGGEMTVSSGAVVTNILENGGNVKIEDGATVSFLENTISGLVVSAYRDATIHSNTTAQDTTVDGGWFFIRGGTASNTTILNGSMWISSGLADTVSIGSNCYLYVSSGGIASGVSTTSSGFVVVSSGGRMEDAVFAGGISQEMVTIYSGGVLSSAQVINGVDLFVRGGSVYEIVLRDANSNGDASDLFLYDGGYAENITINEGGYLVVGSGTLNGVIINPGAQVSFETWNGLATFQNVVVNSGVQFGIDSNLKTDGITVNAGARIDIYDNATATDIVENGGWIEFSGEGSGSFASNTFSGVTLSEGQSATVHSGTTATSTTVTSGGMLKIFSSGIADGVAVSRGGTLNIDRATDVSNVKVMNSGYLNMTIDSGTNVAGTFGGSAFAVAQGAVDGFELNDMKSLSLRDGGTANNAVVSSGGELWVSSGGTATDATVESEGWLHVAGGGTATDATVHVNGRMEVLSKASASGMEVSSGGSVFLHGGATVSGLAMDNGAWLEMTVDKQTRVVGTISGTAFEARDGRLDDFTIGYGRLTIASDGIAYNLTTRDNVDLTVAGGTVHGLTAGSWGWWWGGVRVDGGLLTGQITVTQGNLYFSNDGAILFNVSDLAPDADTTRINDYGRVSDSPLLYATVSDAQMQGSYVLARNAGNFKTYITVNAVDGTFLEELNLGQQFEYAGKTYALNLTDGVLTLDVATVADSVKITISGDTTTELQSTTLTATTPGSTEIYFSTDNVNWNLYQGTLNVTENATYYFKALDGAGNIGTNWISVSNIDKIPPEAPTAKASITADTLGKVSVTASFSNDTAVKEYSLDGENWQPYESGVVFSDNGTVYFRGADEAGNYSQATRYDVTNIIKDDLRRYVFIDPAFGANGEGISEGATHSVTGIPLVWGVNAFSTMDAARDAMLSGQDVYVSNIVDVNSDTNGCMVNLHISGSTIPVLINGFTSGDQVYFGDVLLTVENSTIATRSGSYLFGLSSVSSAWDHPQHIIGNLTLDVNGSTIGGNTGAILVSGMNFVNVLGTAEEAATITLNFVDTIIRDDFTFIGDSPLGIDETFHGTRKGANLVINFDNVLVPQAKWWRIMDGNQESTGTVTVNIKGSTIGGDSSGMRFSLGSWDWGNPRNHSKFVFSVEDSIINGYLQSSQHDDGNHNELINFDGNKSIVLKGDNTILYTYWFDEITLTEGATLTGRGIRMASKGGTINVDVTGYTGKNKVIVSMNDAFENVSSINVTGTGASDYQLQMNDRILILKKNGAYDTIYVNSEYTAQNVVIGTTYDNDPLFFGENAFGDLSSALAALTGDADLRVTGNVTYSGNQAITISGDLINDGVFTISAAGFVDGSQLEATVLTANSISGYGAFTTDSDAYSAAVFDNEVRLVQNLHDVSVCTEWNSYEDNVFLDTWVSTGYWQGTIGVDGFGSLEAAEKAVSILGTIYVYDSDVTFTNPVTHDVIGYGSTTVLRNAKIASGKTLTVSNGAMIEATGLEMAEDASVVFRGGSNVLEFDISSHDSSVAGMANLSRISGRPVWRINMSSNQALGQYVLATGASDISGSFELYVDQQSAGWSLSVTDKDTFTQKGNQMYSLYLSDAGELVLSYVKDTVAPVLTAIGADITAPTNQDVVVSAEFTDDYSMKNVYYRIGENSSWRLYSGNGVTVSDNATVFFYATDTSGNASDVVSYVVDNIDKVAPVAPVVTADITEPTRGSVMLTASFSADSVLNEYSLDGVNWGTYVGPVSFVVNGKAYFRSSDAVGNVSSTTYTVDNIDTVPPEKPLAVADITTPTNRKVTVTASFSADTAVKEYSLDNWTWKEYPAGGVEFTENGTVYFRGKDLAGNISEVDRYNVSNIDTVAPAAPTTSADTTAPTNLDVVVTAAFSEDSIIREYSLDGTNWLSYRDGVTMSGNGTVYFRGQDEAGNISEVATYDVTNINKTAPNKPGVSASITAPTNQSVMVTASFGTECTEKEYSFDQVTWRQYLIPLRFTENGTVYFRGIDSVGNVSDITTYVVDNIDTVAPDAPVVSADITAQTNQDVTVTASFSADSVSREYSVDGGASWQSYTNAITFTTNGSVIFRGWDEAGNVSEEVSYTVGNIDKVAPVIQKVALTQGAGNYDFTATVTATDDTTAMGDLQYLTRYSETAGGVFTASSNEGLRFSLTPEASGKTMYYQAGVQDAAGNLTWSGVQSFTVFDRIAPELHGEPTASFANRTVTVSWDEATDNLGVAGYRLKLNGVVHELQTPGFVLENVTSGSYTYQVSAYDAAGNETSSEEKTLTVEALPDLTIRSAYLEKDGKIVTTVSLEDTVTLRIQVENIGDITSALTSAYVYCGIVPLGEISLSPVDAGRTANFRLTIDAESMSTGVQDIRVVLDPRSLVAEYSELNNEKIISVKVEDHSESDLVIGTIGLAQESYSIDEDLELTFTIRNIGYNVASATKAYIYDGDTFLGSVDVDALEADGESSRLTYKIAAGSLEAGSHVLRVVANGEAFELGMQTVPETDLENNSAQVQVIVGLPDLSFSKLTLSRDTINTEENVTLSFTVRNGGLTTAAASVVGIYDGNQLLGTIAIDELSAGISTTRQFEIAPGILSAGEHDLRVVADYNSEVKESDETNNERSIVLPVTLKDVTPPTFLSISIAQDADYGFTITTSAQDNVTPASELVYAFRFAQTAEEVETAIVQSGNTFSLTSGDACRTMYYQVSATDKAGNTAWSEIQSFTVADHTAPEIGDIMVSIADSALSLSWEATDNIGVTQYKLYFDDALVTTLEQNSYTIENAPSGRHTYRIEAFDAGGNVASTENLNVNIDDTVAPVINSAVAAQSGDGYGITITVNATDNDTVASRLTNRVQYAFAPEDVDAAQFGGLTFTLKPADATKTLYYRVSVSDEAGNMTWTDIQSLTIADTTAPGVPADLAGTVNGFDVSLNWTASEDNVGVMGYLVRYGATESLTGEGVVVYNNSYALNGMKDGVYYWQTAAVDAAGNVSDWSEVKRFRVLPEDAFGAVSTAATAYSLGELSGEQTLTGGVIRTTDDVDWFSFTLNSKGTANDYVQIAFDGREGDLDLYLYSSNGTTLLATSAGSTGDTEKISLKDLAKGSYLLKVVGKNGALNTFNLSTRKVAAYDIDEFDANGRNDTQEAATVFNIDTTPQGSISNLTLHEPWDVDFYQVTLTNMGFSGDSVSISFENSAGDLDLHLFDSKGNIVAASAGTGNTETLSFNGLAAGTYYIQVSAAHNAMNEYTLNWNFTSNKVMADRLEGQEPYSITESVDLTNLSISVAGNGVTQEDTFKLTLQADGNSNSKIRFSNYRGDWNGLKYVVKDSSDAVVLSGTGSEVSLNGLEAGEYTLTVDTPVAGSFSSYDISVSLPENAGAKWTYMVYMATDNNLDSYALYDLISMQQADLDAQIDIYVLVDRSPVKDTISSSPSPILNKWDSNWSDTRVGKISYSPGRNCTVDWESWGELDTSSASTLNRFVTWTQEQSSSENYALLMWDHGFEDGRLCVDGTTNAEWDTALTVSDVASVLRDKDVSLVIFNNCLLGSELTATQMAGSAEVIVASEAESYPSGATYGYKKFFSTITADMTAQEMAEILVQNVRGFPGDSAPSMLSAVDVTDTRLGDALETLANAVSAGKNEADKSVLINGMLKTLQDGFAYPGNIVYQSDLYDVLVQAMADRNYADTSEGFKTAVTNLKSVLEDVVICAKSVPVNRGYGVAVFNPALTAKTYAVAGYSGQQVNDLIYTYLDAAYGSDLAWTGLLYDLATTYQSQYLGASTRAASFAVNSILDLEKAAVVSSMDLGCFSGQGEVVNGIILFDELYFSIVVTEGKNTGKFSVTNDSGANVVISILDENGIEKATGTNSVEFSALDAGDYLILLQSETDCTLTLSFGADWATGVDRLDYAQSKTNEAGVNGNGSASKANALGAGYYSGLLTYQGDSDWYQIGNVYTDKYRIELDGESGLTVEERDANGNLVQTAKFADGKYIMTMLSMNYLVVEGNADISAEDVAKRVNAYSVNITTAINDDTEDTVPPAAPVASSDVAGFTNGDVVVSAAFSTDSVVKEYSLDGENWTTYTFGVLVSENGSVFFRGTDAAGNVSDVTTYEVTNIDKTAPAAPSGLQAVVADQTVTLSWTASTDELSGVKGYVVTYSHDGLEFTANTTDTTFVIENADYATWQWNVKAVDTADNVSSVTDGEAFAVVKSVEPEPEKKFVAGSDINGNGVSDVMFVWTGNNYQHGYWMNGTSEWQSAGSNHPAEWENLGCYDMTGDGKADSVLVGNVVVNDVKGAYIGYYTDAIDNPDGSTWVNIGYLTNADDIVWKNAVGNLTGGAANSIVWYAPELYALGAWTDGTDSWVSLSKTFGGDDWTLVGCGDFDGDGKDSVVMSGLDGLYLYTANVDGTSASMGNANWSGWEVRAIGDFKGDGKDDLVLFHKESGSMVMIADGIADEGKYTSLDQLDAKDWFVVGCGDYNGDQQDDLLVRQYSTGMLGYYTSGDTTQWTELGRGVDMNWTVIA